MLKGADASYYSSSRAWDSGQMEPDGPAQQFNVPLNSRYFQVKADLAERTGAEDVQSRIVKSDFPVVLRALSPSLNPSTPSYYAAVRVQLLPATLHFSPDGFETFQQPSGGALMRKVLWSGSLKHQGASLATPQPPSSSFFNPRA
ncbi:hypothetical protein NQZ68_030876 [Dissostichus eleginoides]|nr:hypothetical protein NQZ68_030876 [Dissostichus eleginoides]